MCFRTDGAWAWATFVDPEDPPLPWKRLPLCPPPRPLLLCPRAALWHVLSSLPFRFSSPLPVESISTGFRFFTRVSSTHLSGVRFSWVRWVRLFSFPEGNIRVLWVLSIAAELRFFSAKKRFRPVHTVDENRFTKMAYKTTKQEHLYRVHRLIFVGDKILRKSPSIFVDFRRRRKSNKPYTWTTWTKLLSRVHKLHLFWNKKNIPR